MASTLVSRTRLSVLDILRTSQSEVLHFEYCTLHSHGTFTFWFELGDECHCLSNYDDMLPYCSAYFSINDYVVTVAYVVRTLSGKSCPYDFCQ